ncbi:ferrous iron transport protein B [Flammeovirga yaeyamensis]|uniref:Ferrous iron transport protein B n=1 Tax=Flammeovirga yaeyamensis TaxID=367791 RepID=A0AAX1N192_9BACT|nr:ferrous iron transport protein B [Flammeovirga yaeyamensis]MBB3698398.1 ferrous iron transport protein B [Flammeovirga yaeyamensis]NMF34251.1 ferrous iron transport protein B [Flammeovirga yaeyamensis]QWG01234.1 ferrous iron transport protein B [Flammeovirga yaeyamensis]
MTSKRIKIALLGNPNVGKSSIFNQLTGLRQKVGNFPGVTVDKKIGSCHITNDIEAQIIDFPGTYSLYPTSSDERVVLNSFSNPSSEDYPDYVVYVADATNLERHLLLLSQVKDLHIPVVLAINMADLAIKQGISIDIDRLSEKLKIKAIEVNGRSGDGISELNKSIIDLIDGKGDNTSHIYTATSEEKKTIDKIKEFAPQKLSNYQALLWAHHYNELPFLDDSQKTFIEKITIEDDFKNMKYQIDETLSRYNTLSPIVNNSITIQSLEGDSLSDKIDKIVTNKIWGPIIFISLLMLVFQSIFSWASVPMDLIDEGMATLNEAVKNVMPEAWYTDLITDGILSGLGGVIIFVPQIAILFFLISLMEESGYMARAVYMFDRIMAKFGMSGRSIVSLISGGACAIPAVMAARTIGNWKERMITIMVTPLISCSARIPVYAILVAFAVPNTPVLGGLLNLQGVAFMGLYLLGIVATLLAGIVFKLILKADAPTFLAMELPSYKMPHWKNVGLTVTEKVKTFIIEAGKVIMMVSIVLWALASYGPGDSIENAETIAKQESVEKGLTDAQTEDYIAAKQLEASYVGIMGKAIEPVFAPLGYDWKISIALVTSFAAREVFVGTMATIYSIGSAGEDIAPLKEKLTGAVDPSTGKHEFTVATAFSLMVFYVFAMQCMSTLAVVKRETKSWKWPLIQFTYMSLLAYFGALFTYHIF